MTGYRVKSSKYNDTSCLTIQFLLGEESHVAFTGSRVLLDQCQAYQEEIPFLTTIKRIDRYFSFT